MINLLIFDLDDTLVDHMNGAEKALLSVTDLIINLGYRKNNYNFSTFYDGYEQYNIKLWNLFEQGKINLAELMEKRFSYINDSFKINEIDAEKVKKIYWNTYVDNCRLHKQWIPLLNELQKKYKMVICTNGIEEIQLKKINKVKLNPFFKKIYCATEHPNCKPNTAYYQSIIHDFNIRPKNAVMIGDSFDNDIKPCKTLGINTLHYIHSEPFSIIENKLRGL